MSIGYIIASAILLIWIVLTIVELTNIHKFNLTYFKRGVTIFKKELRQRFLNWNYFDGIYEEEEGKYVFIPEGKIGYFVTRFRFYRQYGLASSRSLFPITLFGEFKEEKEKLIIEYKISYRLAFLIGASILFWVSLPIITKSFKVIIVSLVGVLLTSLVVYVIYVFKKMKMALLEDEIKKLLKLRK